jgi:hypothetical protein
VGSEYDPIRLFRRRYDPAAERELEAVRRRFRDAGRAYLASPLPWLVWALMLPTAAVATFPVAQRWGLSGVLLLWSGAIVVGGAVESLSIRRAGAGGSPLAAWALRVQGNLSLIALALSALLIWRDLPEGLPGLWLLLVGHSFYALGGLSFPALRRYGLGYQLGGLAALAFASQALPLFAATTALTNLALALAVWRGVEVRDEP